jgi:F0F1-type ATP synthase assembly protein I
MGAVGALLLGLFVDCSAPLFLVAVTLVGAGSGFSVAHFR